MLYKFPEIRKFSDIEKYIDPNLFHIAEKDGYRVINYHVSTPETFPDISDEKSKIVREFRGIIFDMDGNIIRRPLQKFKNLGESKETFLDNIDVSKPHKILNKIDGSMIAVFKVGERIIFGTKLGETEVSRYPQEFAEARANYMQFVTAILDTGATPIFEWVSNKNRIVLDYGEDQLILTAIRKWYSGDYLSYDQMKEYASWFEIPVVKMYNGVLSQSLIDKTRLSEGVEGVVVRFDDGGMVKLKADQYVAMHRAKSDINSEKNVVPLILDSKIDDLKPILPKDDLERISQFEISLGRVLRDIENELVNALQKAQEGSRKDFALNQNIPPYIKHMVFSLWDDLSSVLLSSDTTIFKTINNFITKNCNNNKNYDNMKASGGILQNLPDFKPTMFNSEE
jgi:RNA ligase